MNISLVNKAKESGPRVVALLEEVLNDAKAGKVENIAIITTTTNRTVGSARANGSSFFVMLGALEAMKHDMLTAKDE